MELRGARSYREGTCDNAELKKIVASHLLHIRVLIV